MDTAARDTGQPPDQCLEVGAEAQELGPAAADTPEAAAGAASPELRKQHGVKRHLHKHNLKHRYELQETLGKGTYGKVKRAMERFSGRVEEAGAKPFKRIDFKPGELAPPRADVLLSSELHIRATGLMDSKLREAEALSADDGSAKKKSKFKNFKKFFVIKKRKEALPSIDKNLLKPSQSTSDVTTRESLRMDDDSEDESGSHMGSRALSHDSIFIPDTVQEPARPGRVFSQENVSDHIRTLQMKLQNTIIMGPPPLRIPSKRMDDAGASSEDDGLPRSPPEISLMQEALNPSSTTRFSDTYKRLSSLSLAGTGSEEEEQISPGPSSRPLSPVGQLIPRPTSSRTISPQRSESHISPSADFDSPPQFATCLDNSAAKYRLSIKPRNQRSSRTRKASAKSLSDSLNDLSCTLEEEEVEEGDRNDVEEVFAMDSIGSREQEMEDDTRTKSGISVGPGLVMHQATSQSPSEADILLAVGAIEKAVSSDGMLATLEEQDCEQNVFTVTGTVALEAAQNIHSLPIDINEGLRGVKDPLKAHDIPAENVLASAMKMQASDRKSLHRVSSITDTSPTKQTPATLSRFTPFAETSIAVDTSASLDTSQVEGVSSIKETPAVMFDFGLHFPKRSSGKYLDNSHHVNKPTFPVTHPSSSSLCKVGSTYCPPEKSKSDQPPQASIKEIGQPIGRSGNPSECKVNVTNEVSTLRKFSVSSAWERPKTGSFNLKKNSERVSQLSLKSFPSKSNFPVSGSEKHKVDEEHFLELQDEKISSKKQESPLNAEPKSEEKSVPDFAPNAPNTAVTVTDTVGHSQCQFDAKDQSPFQVKLRATSFSLRYRDGSATEARSNKRYSAEFKVEKETYAPISKEYGQTKKNDFNVGSPLTEVVKSKAKSTENLETKPPLPRKPILQTKMSSACSANIENQENNTKPTESRAEAQEEEKKSSFYKFAEKSVLSPVNTLETVKGTDSPPEPTWMTRVKQKQWGMQEQALNLGEKLTQPEGKVECVLQEKNKDNVEVSPKQVAEIMQIKNSPSASKVTSDDSIQYGKNEPNETRPRAHTLSHPIPVNQPSLPAEKAENTQSLRATPAGSERPSWMDLAKKKSQAWHDMPQIIK